MCFSKKSFSSDNLFNYLYNGPVLVGVILLSYTPMLAFLLNSFKMNSLISYTMNCFSIVMPSLYAIIVVVLFILKKSRLLKDT